MKTLAWIEFEEQAKRLCESTKHQNLWRWRDSPFASSGFLGFAFLPDWSVSQAASPLEEAEDEVEACEDHEIDALVEPVEDLAAEASHRPAVHTYQLHIVYSPNYQVPVLYFNGVDSDGVLLGIDAIWADIPASHKTDFAKSHISQGEHPSLGLPYYFVHPCNTAALMGALDAPTSSYLPNWLSWVSPLFSLPITLK